MFLYNIMLTFQTNTSPQNVTKVIRHGKNKKPVTAINLHISQCHERERSGAYLITGGETILNLLKVVFSFSSFDIRRHS